jgi:uncharacterized SAM-binding protein YcdF (DUF218 family)
MARTRRLVSVVVVGLAGLALALAALHGPILRSLGSWLHVEDPLEHADALVVLAGGTPWREATAAALWQAGWAPRVMISRPSSRPDLQELIELGIRKLDLQGESRAVLEAYGVPSDRIVAIEDAARTTEPELELVRAAAGARGYRRLIFVTSPEHTRRVRVTWSREAPGGPEGIVVATREDFPFDDWWRRRRAAESVLHEYLGLLAIGLGISQFMQ